jgi:hypothetical protein
MGWRIIFIISLDLLECMKNILYFQYISCLIDMEIFSIYGSIVIKYILGL